MKQRFWLFKRGSVFYLQDSETGRKDSLGTRDPKQAKRLRTAKNEAAEKPLLGLTLGKACLSAYDPKLVERKWSQVMDEFGQRGRDSSRARYARALKSSALATLREKKIVDTTPDDFRAALADNKPSTNHFLRRIHILAVGKLASDPHFRDHVLFHEYFHGDTGRSVGASHQTGWTGLIAKLLQPRGEEGVPKASQPAEAKIRLRSAGSVIAEA
jgi:hypothetical protein